LLHNHLIMSHFPTIQQNIHHRRTIKPEAMNGKIIDPETLMSLLELANWAPTHGFTEPWRFVVFSGNGLHQWSEFHAALYKNETPEDKFQQIKYDQILARTAKVSHVLAIVMKRGTNPKIPRIEEQNATAIAAQNIWLGASAQQIACYWGSGGMNYHPKMKAYLDFDEEDEVLGFLYLGYTDQEWPKGKRLTPIEDKISFRE
jgi:nitroreductase